MKSGFGGGFGFMRGRGPKTAPQPYPNTVAPPAITGTAREGQTLTVSNGTWTNSPTSYTYQWKRDGVNIAAATASTYALVTADVGAQITCTVTATNAVPLQGTATTAPTSTVLPLAPTNSVAPAITGTTEVGALLSCSDGTWANNPTNFTFQWKGNGSPLAGETANTLHLAAGYNGMNITCTVTASNTGGSNSVTTASVGPITTPASGFTITKPQIDLTSAVVGDPAPSWQANFVDPASQGADMGDTIECRYGTSNAAMLAMTPVQEILDAGELIDGDALFPEFDTWAAAQAVGTTLHWQIRAVRTPGVEESDWSTEATFLIADGVADSVAFTDQTNVAASTLIWSAPITIAGLAAGAKSRFTVAAGGQLRVNGGAGTTAEVLVQNGDTLAAAVTSSAVSGNIASVQVFQRGTLYDTFQVTTAGTAVIDVALQGTALSAAGTATYTFAGMALGTDDATRIIIARVGSRKGTGGNAVPTGVTIAGVAATLIAGVQADSASGNVAATIWAAAVPTGATGDVVVTHAAAMSRCGVTLDRMVNGSITPASSGTAIDVATGTVLSATPTIPANACLVAVATCHATGGSDVWAGATEDFDTFLSGTNLSPFTGAKSTTAGSPALSVTMPSSSSRSMAWAVFGTA